MLTPAQLKDLAVFGGLAEADLTLIRELLEERVYEPGASVVEEGAPGRDLFVIEEGEAEILKRAAAGGEVRIAQLGPGACFGEMALVGIMRRAASVRAGSQLRTLSLSYPRVAELAREHPQTFTMLIMNLARELCRRLQQADAVLGEFGISCSPSSTGT